MVGIHINWENKGHYGKICYAIVSAKSLVNIGCIINMVGGVSNCGKNDPQYLVTTRLKVNNKTNRGLKI